MDLATLVNDFAHCLELADAKCPQAINVRSKKPFRPGIGPHTEAQSIRLIAAELALFAPFRYQHRIAMGIPYPESPRQKCDLCIGGAPQWEWAVEVKMLRLLGDNGKLNDNILMHILSPYPQHRSALTDCLKLSASCLGNSKAILIYGFEHTEWPLELAIEAFEVLARSKVEIGPRCSAVFEGLVHPIHSRGKVFAWELIPPSLTLQG